MVLPVIIVFLALLGVSMGCQEKNYDDTKKDDADQIIISKTKAMCPNKNWIKYTRFFGNGTFELLIVILVLLF